jgi:hypothetical protein
MRKLCWKVEMGWNITLHQTGVDRFLVTYGVEKHEGNYEFAARELGECIMHALACEGLLDSHTKGEK